MNFFRPTMTKTNPAAVVTGSKFSLIKQKQCLCQPVSDGKGINYLMILWYNKLRPADDNNAVWRKTDRKDVLIFT